MEITESSIGGSKSISPSKLADNKQELECDNDEKTLVCGYLYLQINFEA